MAGETRAICVVETDPGAPACAAVLASHWLYSAEDKPTESCHVLGVEELRRGEVTFWAAIDGEIAVGVVALLELGGDRGEVKSMHVLESSRGQGVADRLFDRVADVARRRGYRELVLETGTAPRYAPARRFYARRGFAPCAPFGGYKHDPLSVFMSLRL